jgi:hypothetical protein
VVWLIALLTESAGCELPPVQAVSVSSPSNASVAPQFRGIDIVGTFLRSRRPIRRRDRRMVLILEVLLVAA